MPTAVEYSPEHKPTGPHPWPWTTIAGLLLGGVAVALIGLLLLGPSSLVMGPFCPTGNTISGNTISGNTISGNTVGPGTYAINGGTINGNIGAGHMTGDWNGNPMVGDWNGAVMDGEFTGGVFVGKLDGGTFTINGGTDTSFTGGVRNASITGSFTGGVFNGKVKTALNGEYASLLVKPFNAVDAFSEALNGSTFTISGETFTINGGTLTINGGTFTISGETFTLNGEMLTISGNNLPGGLQFISNVRQAVGMQDLSIEDDCPQPLSAPQATEPSEPVDQPTETVTEISEPVSTITPTASSGGQPPPPAPTEPLAECAAGWLPASGCVCCGTTLTCADGTVATFNPQCMGGGDSCNCVPNDPLCTDPLAGCPFHCKENGNACTP